MVCFVGVDMGTSKSGYSYCFSAEASAIKIPTQFTPDDEIGAPKTDTALLFEVTDSGWQLVCWGTAAVNRYKTSRLCAADATYRLVTGKQFKLALAEGHTQLPAEYQLPQDCPFSPPQLISMMLKCLRQHAAQHLQQSVGVHMDTAEVHYCLSVPAGWSLKAKRIMHYAAEEAGMKLTPRHDAAAATDARGRDQDRAAASVGASAVVLIHEQEAAALTACRDPCKDVPTLKAIPGQVWLILDAGGGTVDIAMHRIEQGSTPGSSQLSEVLRATCLLQGSTRLDQKAEELLLSLFDGAPWEFERWKQEDPQGYISQMREWELVKMKFGIDAADVPVFLKLEYSLLERLPPHLPGMQHGRLRIDPSSMRALVFDPVIDPILAEVQRMLSVPRRSDGGTGADVLIMAGGFGSNGYLRRRVVEVCGSLLRNPPVTPANASRSVVYGNTIHLQQPEAIIARVARMTYGVGCSRRPTQQRIKEGHTVTDKRGQSWCDTHFWPLVKVDQTVKLGESTAPFTVYPMPGASKVRVPIYATEASEAYHTMEAGMQQMGAIEIDISRRRKGIFSCLSISDDEYKIELTFEFGSAEMQVRAYDVFNQCQVQCSVEFSSEVASGGCRVSLPGA